MRAERHTKRSAENPEYRARRRASYRAWYRRNRDKRREKRRSEPEYRKLQLMRTWTSRWRKQGFESMAERYERMLKQQNGVCAICKRKSVRRLCVDHCHVMEMLRALLCHKCNMALGGFDHDSNRLREAAAYLDLWRVIHQAEGGRRGDAAPRSKPGR